MATTFDLEPMVPDAIRVIPDSDEVRVLKYRIDALITALTAVKKTDKTSQNEYRPNSHNGFQDLPAGSKWCTPREIAIEALAEDEKMARHRQ